MLDIMGQRYTKEVLHHGIVTSYETDFHYENVLHFGLYTVLLYNCVLLCECYSI